MFLWEPNSDVHTSSGVANALSVYGLSTTETSAQPLKYVGIKAPFNKDAGVLLKTSKDHTDYFQEVTPKLITPKDMGTDRPYMTLQPGITKIRVYMWVEGEDVDCENDASGVNIGYNLQFTVAQ